jgi:hypothetical protein
MKKYIIEIHTKNQWGVGKLTHGSKEDSIVFAINEALTVLKSFDGNSEVLQIIAKKI